MNNPRDEIIRSYHRTTSRRAGEMTSERLEQSALGLKRRLKGWLPPSGSSVLDLGCGRGELLYLMKQIGLRSLTGVNLCADELHEAAQFVEANFHCMDVINFLSNSDTQYDYIFALNLFEHFEKDKLYQLFSNTLRCLKSGGTLILMVPNAVSPFGAMTRHWDYTHEWAFTQNNFEQLIELTGFQAKIQFRECGPIAHGFISLVRVIMWKFIRQLIRLYFFVEFADEKGGVYTADMLVRIQKK